MYSSVFYTLLYVSILVYCSSLSYYLQLIFNLESYVYYMYLFSSVLLFVYVIYVFSSAPQFTICEVHFFGHYCIPTSRNTGGAVLELKQLFRKGL
jgi:hypothetical protein